MFSFHSERLRHSRVLTPLLREWQRGEVGARVLEIYQKEALQRKREGGKEAGRGRPKQDSRNNGTHIDRTPPAAKGFGRASDVAGATVGGSGDSVDRAVTVLPQ